MHNFALSSRCTQEYPQWWLQQLGNLKEKETRHRPSPVTRQILSENWLPHLELIQILSALLLQARNYSTQNYTLNYQIIDEQTEQNLLIYWFYLCFRSIDNFNSIITLCYYFSSLQIFPASCHFLSAPSSFLCQACSHCWRKSWPVQVWWRACCVGRTSAAFWIASARTLTWLHRWRMFRNT